MKKKLDMFMSQFPRDLISRELKRKYSIKTEQSLKVIDTFSNEAEAALKLIEGHLTINQKVLEIGAGLCIFSLFLKSEGFNIIALEPSLGGYGLFEKMKNEILLNYPNLGLEVLNIPADKLESEMHGYFDLIFSNNVIEHIPNLDESFLSMRNVLEADGKMLHSCPNYIVPYEPHFGVFVIKPFSPLFKRMFRVDLKENAEVWDSLNFITYFDVKRIAKENNLIVSYKKEILYDSLLRLDNDEIFYARHAGGFVHKVFLILKRTRLLKMIKYFPVLLSTPMAFSLSYAKEKNEV
jgi:SAM-dependent methyltransferase